MTGFPELFPAGEEFDDFLPSDSNTSTLDLQTSLVAAIITMMFFRLLHQIYNDLFFWAHEMVNYHDDEYDLEEGIHSTESYTAFDLSDNFVIFQDTTHNNVQTWRMQMDANKEEIDVRRGKRLRDSKLLPPLVDYGCHEKVKNYSDCAICLEEFEGGQFCQVFSTCKHIFHSHCIDCWLQKKLTCPICRGFVLG